ncbi:MAG TPA: hypothetical protein VIJ12_00195 [Candidatus Baltobacteraceae bacterium]
MRWTMLCAAFAAAITGLTLPARADISVAGGGYTSSSPSTTGGAVMLSTGASIPAVPVEVQATVFVPLAKQGGYAITGEVRGFTGGGFGGAFVGAGAGIGTLSADRTVGPVITIFAGKQVAPFTAIEIRVIKSTREGGTTAGFLGLRFTF